MFKACKLKFAAHTQLFYNNILVNSTKFSEAQRNPQIALTNIPVRLTQLKEIFPHPFVCVLQYAIHYGLCTHQVIMFAVQIVLRALYTILWVALCSTRSGQGKVKRGGSLFAEVHRSLPRSTEIHREPPCSALRTTQNHQEPLC